MQNIEKEARREGLMGQEFDALKKEFEAKRKECEELKAKCVALELKCIKLEIECEGEKRRYDMMEKDRDFWQRQSVAQTDFELERAIKELHEYEEGTSLAKHSDL
jgi:hypothetical protein